MIKIIKINNIIILTMIILLYSCDKKDEYPITPYIEFDSFTKINNDLPYDTKGIMKFTFTDGDGDLGLGDEHNFPPFDTSSIYHYNCFMDYYEKQEGEFIKVDPLMPFYYRIPVVNTSENPKPIKGVIEIEMAGFYDPGSIYDTIYFEMFIVDRALNKSNIIRTPEIIVNK